MAAQDVQNIIQGLIAGQQRRRDAVLAAQGQQRLEQEKTAQEAEIQNRKDQLAELKRQHDTENTRLDLQQKAAQAVQRMQQLREQQAIGEGLSQGQAVPGDTLVSKSGPDENGNEFETHNIEGIGTITIPSRTTANRFSTEKKAAEEKPAQDFAKEQAFNAAQNALNLEGARSTAQEKNTQTIVEAENQRAKEAQEAENHRAAAANATHLRAAQISQGLDPEGIGNSAEPYIQQVHNGDLSMEQLQGLKLPKGIHNAVVAGVSGTGDVVPTNSELKAVQTYAPIKNVVQAIDAYNQNLKQNGWVKTNIPGTDAYKTKKALEAQMDALTPGISRTIGTETGRLSNTQIKMAEELANGSSNFLTSSPETNQQKRDALLKLGNDALDANLARLPAGQKATLKAKTGLTSIPYLGGQQAQPPIPGQQPQGAAQPQVQHLYFDAKGNPVQQ